jgi:hypothetical protein
LSDAVLAAVGPFGVRPVRLDNEGLTPITGYVVQPANPSALPYWDAWQLGVSAQPNGRHRLSVPTAAYDSEGNSLGFGISLFDVDPDGGLTGPTFLGGPYTIGVSRSDGFTVGATPNSDAPADVRVIDDDGVQVSSLDLPGSSYNWVLVSGELGFAATSFLAEPANLSVFTLAPNGQLTARQQIALDASGLMRAGVTYSPSPGQTLQYLLFRRSNLSSAIEIYDVSSLPAAPRLHTLTPANLSVRGLSLHGRYLIAFYGQASGRRQFAVFDLGASIAVPPDLATVGFEVPLRATSESNLTNIVAFRASGKDYLYLAGAICVTDCVAGSPQRGTWLLELAPDGIRLAHPTPVAVNLGSLLSLVSGATRGPLWRQNGLLQTGTAADGQSAALLITDVSDPKAPIAVPEVPLGDVPADASTRIALKDNLLLLAWASADGTTGGGIFFDVTDPLSPRRAGRVQGVGPVASGVIESASRAILNTGFGVLRLDISDLGNPAVTGGQEGVFASEVSGNRIISRSSLTLSFWDILP